MTYQIFVWVTLLLGPFMALFRTAGEGVYTKEQAARGRVVYGEECAKCHGEVLTGGDGAPELTGPDFLNRWNRKRIGDLFALMKKSMPTDDPGRLSNRQYADISAFILTTNGFPAGREELPVEESLLNEITIDMRPALPTAKQ